MICVYYPSAVGMDPGFGRSFRWWLPLELHAKLAPKSPLAFAQDIDGSFKERCPH
jgi:hypothetical protein